MFFCLCTSRFRRELVGIAWVLRETPSVPCGVTGDTVCTLSGVALQFAIGWFVSLIVEHTALPLNSEKNRVLIADTSPLEGVMRTEARKSITVTGLILICHFHSTRLRLWY